MICSVRRSAFYSPCLTFGVACLLALGFSSCTTETAVAPTETAATTDLGTSAEVSPSEAAVPGAVALTPENTTIEFIGTHVVEEKPDPNARHGKFQELTGSAVVTDGKLVSVTVDIPTESLTTGNEKLDAHLKNADFFHVKAFPQIKFTTTAVKANEDGTYEITGDLTLLETTKSVTFPAKVSTEGGLTLDAEFTIDRTEYGINFDTSKVEKEVPITIHVKARSRH